MGAAAGALAGIVLVSCTSVVVGSPTPAPATTSSSANPPGGGNGEQGLPARPRELRVDGVDPCALLTPDQQRELGTDRQPSLADEPDRLGNYACDYNRVFGAAGYGYSVIPVPQQGADTWLTGKYNVVVKVVRVGEFGAVETRLPGDHDLACNVVVDVAEGQSLDVQFTLITAGAMTLDQLCANAKKGAEFAVETLKTLR
ncbi:DUF3558 domain-containing protein [Goodfellowiella coeruleoviolacea]|uniref:DUF3558 domain-containing protein n=1 Tax=Goodfellowiella coeruleoviolacea TaxID=334858 RepID=UPI0020A523AF|nr:DUF3558 domain-containing protein [Goodfellowiella coeruleoviolacea]